MYLKVNAEKPYEILQWRTFRYAWGKEGFKNNAPQNLIFVTTIFPYNKTHVPKQIKIFTKKLTVNYN